MESEKTQKNIAALSLCGLFIAPALLVSASASEPEMEHELRDYAVVATRTPVELGALSISTSYLDATTLEQRQYFTLSDALKELPGTAVVQNGHVGALSSLFTRGTESNHTAIFLNGRRLPAGTMGQYDLSSLGIENLSSVEFIRGPSSSLYGSDAIGGVIDLRSKEAIPETQSTVLSAEHGSFNSQLIKYETLIGTESFSLSAGMSHFETENDRPNSDYERLAANTYATYRIHPKLHLDFQGLYYDNQLGVPGDERYPIGTPFGTYPANEINQTEAYLLSPGLTFEFDENLSLTSFFSRSRSKFSTEMAPFASNYDFEETVDEWCGMVNFSPSDHPVLLTGGLSYLRLQYDREPNAPGSATTPFQYSYRNHAIFGQAIWDITQVWRFIGSIRFDQFDAFKNSTTGNAEFSYYLPRSDTRFFLKYGTGMAPAEANDIARLEGKLEPESSESWEIGFKQIFADKKLELGMIYFNSRIDNLVDDDGGWPTARYEVVDTKQQGVETELNWQITSEINSRIAYTFLDAEVTKGTYFFGDVPGTPLIRRPKHSIAVNLDWEASETICLGLGFLAIHDREDPAGTRHEDYEVFRLYGDWQVDEYLSLYGRVENLLNQHFTYTPGYSNSGSALYLGARLKF